MKKKYMKKVTASRFFILACFVCFSVLLPAFSNAQTYYSAFPSTAGKFAVSPDVNFCNVPQVLNGANLADYDLTNFASFTGTGTTEFNCDETNSYGFGVALNLPPDSTSISGNPQVGFKIRTPGGMSAPELAKHLSLYTTLQNSFAESSINSQLILRDIGTDSTNWFVYFNTTMPFDYIWLNVDFGIFPMNQSFEFDAFFGFASYAGVFPVTINDFKAMPAGRNITLSWQSLNETNISNYRIERSANGGSSYTAVGSLQAKASNGNTMYTYTDKSLAGGNYLYRLAAVDKNGSLQYTNSVFASLTGTGKEVLYPSVVSAGQIIHITPSTIGKLTISVYDVEGKIVKQQLSNSESQVSLSTAGLSAGTYLIKITTATGTVSQAKFIVN